jgi:hypothetical protein
LIYEKTFVTRELANGYALSEIKNDVQMEKYMFSQAKAILNSEAFEFLDNLSPENGVLNFPKEDFENHDVFLECKNEKRPLFCICLSEEDITNIGFSTKHMKVFDIVYCC